MRPAALRLVRYRHHPMQHSLDCFSGSPIKRSHSQQATARVQLQQQPVLPDFPPQKRQRSEEDSFSPVRRRNFPHSSSPIFKNTMAFRGKPLSKRTGGPSSDVDRPPSSHRHQPKQSKRGGRSSAPKSILNGPFHDQDFIVKEYFKSGVDLKGHYKHTPKSPLHNFYAIVKDGQQPRYEFSRGSIIKGDKYVEVWRFVRSKSFTTSPTLIAQIEQLSSLILTRRFLE